MLVNFSKTLFYNCSYIPWKGTGRTAGECFQGYRIASSSGEPSPGKKKALHWKGPSIDIVRTAVKPGVIKTHGGNTFPRKRRRPVD